MSDMAQKAIMDTKIGDDAKDEVTTNQNENVEDDVTEEEDGDADQTMEEEVESATMEEEV